MLFQLAGFQQRLLTLEFAARLPNKANTKIIARGYRNTETDNKFSALRCSKDLPKGVAKELQYSKRKKRETREISRIKEVRRIK